MENTNHLYGIGHRHREGTQCVPKGPLSHLLLQPHLQQITHTQSSYSATGKVLSSVPVGPAAPQASVHSQGTCLWQGHTSACRTHALHHDCKRRKRTNAVTNVTDHSSVWHWGSQKHSPSWWMLLSHCAVPQHSRSAECRSQTKSSALKQELCWSCAVSRNCLPL